jgi:hypothetical protein
MKDIGNVNPPAVVRPAETRAAKVKRLYAALAASDRDNLSRAIEIGNELLAEREACVREMRPWLKWLGEEAGITQPTASRYMDVAKAYSPGGLLFGANNLGLTESLDEIHADRHLSGPRDGRPAPEAGGDGLSSPAAPELAAAEAAQADDGGPPKLGEAFAHIEPEPPKPPTARYRAEEPPDPAARRGREAARRRRRRYYFLLGKPQEEILGKHPVTHQRQAMQALALLGNTPLAREVARMLVKGESKRVKDALLVLAAEAARAREAGACGADRDAGDHGDADTGAA